MSENGNGPKMVDKAVNSAILTLIARGAMIAAAAALPFVGKLIADKADKVIEKVDATANKVELLEQSVRYELQGIRSDVGGNRKTVDDHEARIRYIENRPTAPRTAQ